MIDHTNLKPYATKDDFRKLCDEAIQYGFKSVAINTYPVAMCAEMLEGSEVLTGAAISFPLGQMPISSKVAEAENAVKDGCQEFDYVMNIGKAKEIAKMLITMIIKNYLKEEVYYFEDTKRGIHYQIIQKRKRKKQIKKIILK